MAIYATVLDANGRLVPDLEREHFELLDNGKPQTLTVFRSDVQPVSVVVMLDTSGSMTLNIDLLKLAAEQFVIRLHPQDRARIGSFSDDIRLSPTFTSNRDDMIRILHTDIRYGNPTYLWDAIDLSMDALAKEEGRKVILVFTDGEHSKSVKTDFDQLLARVHNDETMIYAIGLQSQVLGTVTKPDRRLRVLSATTGGTGPSSRTSWARWRSSLPVSRIAASRTSTIASGARCSSSERARASASPQRRSLCRFLLRRRRRYSSS